MRTTCLMACAILLAAAPAAAADIPIPAVWVGAIEYGAGSATIVMAPDGAGPPLGEARIPGVGVVDATVEVRLVDQNGMPVNQFPREDVWLQFAVAPGTARSCLASHRAGGHFMADTDTDPQGRTRFSLPLAGGGWSETPVTVYVNGQAATSPEGDVFVPLQLRVVSPDLDGSLTVDLSDVAILAGDFHGAYHFRSDLNVDGVLDLSDIVVMAQHVGAGCP